MNVYSKCKAVDYSQREIGEAGVGKECLSNTWDFPDGDYEESRLPGCDAVWLFYKQHLLRFEEFHGGDYEECRLLGYKNPPRTSQETRCVSVTEPSLLMLCKIRGFHGGDYEECRVLGYEIPLRTSQGTQCASATEPCGSCKNRCFGGTNQEEKCIKWAAEKYSGSMICIPSFIKTGSGGIHKAACPLHTSM
jgi:hypothetical protein